MFEADVSNVCKHVSTLEHVGCGPVGPCGSGGPCGGPKYMEGYKNTVELFMMSGS